MFVKFTKVDSLDLGCMEHSREQSCVRVCVHGDSPIEHGWFIKVSEKEFSHALYFRFKCVLVRILRLHARGSHISRTLFNDG